LPQRPLDTERGPTPRSLRRPARNRAALRRALALDRRLGPARDLGEGFVTAGEAGGVVTVRFASDGSERRLMLDYAPLERTA